MLVENISHPLNQAFALPNLWLLFLDNIFADAVLVVKGRLCLYLLKSFLVLYAGLLVPELHPFFAFQNQVFVHFSRHRVIYNSLDLSLNDVPGFNHVFKS